jgi:hypothetical protein
MGSLDCLETSVRNHHSAVREISEELKSHSRTISVLWRVYLTRLISFCVRSVLFHADKLTDGQTDMTKVSRIRTESVSLWFCSQAVSKPVWHIPLLSVQWKSADDGQRNCPKHVEFYSKNIFEKLVHLVGFIIIIYHDARSPKCHYMTMQVIWTSRYHDERSHEPHYITMHAHLNVK